MTVLSEMKSIAVRREINERWLFCRRLAMPTGNSFRRGRFVWKANHGVFTYQDLEPVLSSQNGHLFGGALTCM